MAVTPWFGESLKSTALAASDLSSNEFYAVTVGSSGVSLVATQGQSGIKILTNKPQQGDPAQLWDYGETKCVAGAAITVGQQLMTDSSGRMIPWVDHNHQAAVAEARSPATQAGELFTAFVYGTSAPDDITTTGAAAAAAGTSVANATQLTAMFTDLTAVTASTGVILPPAKAGSMAIIGNMITASGHAVQVYGNGSDTIDTVAGSTGVTLTDSATVGMAIFWCAVDGVWHSMKSGGLSS
jgi:hypothetical protein